MSDSPDVQYLSRPDGQKVAYVHTAGRKPGLVWCGGFKSDMDGGKATTLEAWAKAKGAAYTRFDYFGHGKSSGAFKDGTISRWCDDTLAVIDEVTDGPLILVGSSMGGWTALLAALARPERVAGLLLIAPAPDFTEDLMWEGFSDDIRETIEREGIYYEPSEYSPEPTEITRDLIYDGRKNLILKKPVVFDGPVRILQGVLDPDVPWPHAHQLLDAITSDDVEITLVKSGDHRLSEPRDLDRLMRTADQLVDQLSSDNTA